jgi:hypothetical protein
MLSEAFGMQLLSAEIFSSVRKHCPPEKSSTSRYLSRLADLPISRFADKFGSAEPRPPNSFRPSSRVPRPVLSRWLRNRSLLKQANLEVASVVRAFKEKALTLNPQRATQLAGFSLL